MQNEETDINVHSVQLPNKEILRQISSGGETQSEQNMKTMP
jgi:hypothetical protein